MAFKEIKNIYETEISILYVCKMYVCLKKALHAFHPYIHFGQTIVYIICMYVLFISLCRK